MPISEPVTGCKQEGDAEAVFTLPQGRITFPPLERVRSTPPRPDGPRMREGWLLKGSSEEQGTETGLAEMQLGLGPGTRLQPVDRIGQCAWAVA